MAEQQIPQHALERLKGLRSQGHPDGIFTSDFSVNEFLLVRKAGFEPVGLCVGSCIYHLGFQFAGWGSNVELEQLSLAMYEARALAMERMRLEARNMGADGIVGVRLTVKRLEWDRSWNSWRSARASFTPRVIRGSRGRTASLSPLRSRVRISGPCYRRVIDRSKW